MGFKRQRRLSLSCDRPQDDAGAQCGPAVDADIDAGRRAASLDGGMMKMDRDRRWLGPRECGVCGLKYVPRVTRMRDFRVFCVCPACLDRENAKDAMVVESKRTAAVTDECRDRLAMYGMLE